jgi:hypothetical protein
MIDHIVVSSLRRLLSPPIISAAGRPGTFVHGAAAGVSLSLGKHLYVQPAGRPANVSSTDREDAGGGPVRE